VNLPCVTNACYDQKSLVDFMHSSEVIDTLGERAKKWRECNGNIYTKFIGEYDLNAAQK